MSERKEHLCMSCLCSEDTIFMPPLDRTCCAQYSSDLNCCMFSKSSCCICKGHAAYDDMVDGRDDIICISQGTSALVKPYCLNGTKPVCKSSMTGWCCSRRCALPCDSDVTSSCSVYGLKCCLCCPFKCEPECLPARTPIPESAFGGYSVDIAEANVSEEYLLCALGCCLCTMYIPNTYADAFGQEATETCLCTECDAKANMLPKSPDGYEILVQQMSTVSCVKPKTCVKGKSRQNCMVTKCAIPCDEEVPMSLACCGFVCVGQSDKLKAPTYLKTIEEQVTLKSGAPEVNEMTR